MRSLGTVAVAVLLGIATTAGERVCRYHGKPAYQFRVRQKDIPVLVGLTHPQKTHRLSLYVGGARQVDWLPGTDAVKEYVRSRTGRGDNERFKIYVDQQTKELILSLPDPDVEHAAYRLAASPILWDRVECGASGRVGSVLRS